MPVVISKSVVTILDWPTETVSMDWVPDNNANNKEQQSKSERPEKNSSSSPLVWIIFIPGNPGYVGFYESFFQRLLQSLQLQKQQQDIQFAIRLCSYAGHGRTKETVQVQQQDDDENNNDERNISVPWSINGQVLHKIAWLDMELQQQENHPRFLFITHSIGAHLVQRMLLLRPDWAKREQTFGIIHWMPFIRMNASWNKQLQLNIAANHPYTTMSFIRDWLLPTLLLLFRNNNMIVNRLVPSVTERTVVHDILQHYKMFIRNFLELGAEEIRNLPQHADTFALSVLDVIPTAMLYCGNDHWAPHFHFNALQQWRAAARMTSLYLTYNPSLIHDFIVHPTMVPFVLEWTFDHVLKFCQRKNSHSTNDEHSITITPMMMQSKL